MAAIAFVTTGLQTLNTLELINHLNLNDVHLCICADKPRTIKEVESLKSEFKWRSVRYLPGRSIALSSNFIVYNLFYVIGGLLNFNKLKGLKPDIIIGNDINPYFNAYVQFKSRDETQVYLIDDGSGSINLDLNEVKYRFLKHPRNKILYQGLGIKNYRLKVDYFFTSYKGFKQFDELITIENSWSFLKSKLKSQKARDVFIFIGDPHVERGYLSEVQFLDILADIKRNFGKDIIYMPRAMESASKLENVKAFAEILPMNKPFEVFMANSDFYPLQVIAFHSTVLFTMKQLYEDRIKYHWMKLPNFTNQKHMESLEQIWIKLDQFAVEFKFSKKA